MGGASSHDREIEVEQSRAKLTKDLATLCSAKTLSAFSIQAASQRVRYNVAIPSFGYWSRNEHTRTRHFG